MDGIRNILVGIDMTEVEHPEGWWETSTGAEFGAAKLAEVEAAVRRLLAAERERCADICARLNHAESWEAAEEIRALNP